MAFKRLIQNGTKFLSSMGEAPKDDVLESVYTTKMRDSEQLKTTSALYHQNTVQNNESPSCTRLNDTVKRYLDQETKDRNFDARNDRAANAAIIRRKSEDRNKSDYQQSQQYCPEVEANVIDQDLLRWCHDHKAKTAKMEKGASKGQVPKGTRQVNQISLRVLAALKGKMHETVMRSWAAS